MKDAGNEGGEGLEEPSNISLTNTPEKKRSGGVK